MRRISVNDIRKVVNGLCLEANIYLRPDILAALKRSIRREKKSISKYILYTLISNAKEAKYENLPICQDTGMVVVFVKIGQDVRITGGSIKDAINSGVRDAYKNLRKSVVISPIYRKNTGDNTPAIIHYDIVKGDRLEIIVSPKGFGSENKSCVTTLEPSCGVEDIKKFVIDTVKSAGPDACPPFVIGIGIGGTMDKAACLAKESLLQPIDKHNPDKRIAKLEKELLNRVNELDIGPMGLGGRVTALGVNIITYPTHIAGLPVAVNISCHALRSAGKVL